jgi:ferredoxin
MKLHRLGSKDKMVSRREFLRIPRPNNAVILILDKEKCTGCCLCTIDCPTKALVISQMSEKETYQLLFLKEICNACGVCEKSCPEDCLQLVERESEQDRIVNPVRNSSGALNPAAEQRGIISNGVKEAEVIFEDKISKCMECGITLFPLAMVKKLESKVFMTKEYAWPFHLCPSCRMRSQFKDDPILRNFK